MGCVYDFRHADDRLDAVLNKLEGKYIEEIVDFKGISSSTENIAKYIYKKLSSCNWPNNVALNEITVWEDKQHGASYKE